MKTFTKLLIGLLVLCTYSVQAQTTISSNITVNTTFTAINSPYIVTSNIDVNQGITLTIEEGVSVLFNSGRYMRARGTINATGATFSGNNGITKGFWDGLHVSSESGVPGTINLTDCIVEHAANIYLYNGNLTLNGTTLNNFSQNGVRIYNNSALDIENTTISNTTFPLSFYGTGVVNSTGTLNFTDNTNNYIELNLSGFNTSFRLKDVGIPYYKGNSTLTVEANGTLIIDPGVQIALNNYSINIDGAIQALGTAEAPITFMKSASATAWNGINIRSGSAEPVSVFQYCNIKDATQTSNSYTALRINNSSPVFENCNFSNNRYNLQITGNSKPTFTNCSFGQSTYVNLSAYNITMDLNAQPIFTNCDIEFNDSELRAILISASTVTADNTLKKISFNGIENITYCLDGTTTISESANVVIEPGIVIKSRSNSAILTANGTLNGIGTAAEPIVFTTLADDNFGNPADTQNNGNTTPSYTNGGKIILNSTAESKLDNWKIHYSSGNYNDWAVYVAKNNILTNSEIANTYDAVRYTDNAVVSNNNFINITRFPVSTIASNGTPDIHGNSLTNAGYSGIHLFDVANDSPTLKKMDFAGITNTAYIIDNRVTVRAGNILTIEPGVVIKFSNNSTSYPLLINGALKAIGTETDRITFTSIHNDSKGGDTNNNGTLTIPTSTNWDGIRFTSSTLDAENILKYAEISYVSGGGNNAAAIQFENCKAVVDHVNINFGYNCGIGIFGTANPEIKNSSFTNLGWEPIYMDMFSNPTFSENNTMANVGGYGLRVRGGTLNGTIPIRSFGGYANSTYAITETYTSSTELIFPAGLVFKGSGNWQINGKVDIQGTSDNPVVFTTLEDDAHGFPKDYQQNGATTNPANSGSYFVFSNSSDDASVINNAVFRYTSGIPIRLTNSSPTIQNCKFENIINPGISLVGTSTPTINNSIFHNVSFPFTTSLVTYPASTSGNIISGTTARAIRVTDETLNQNVTLAKRDFAGITNIPYVFQSYTVGTSAKLTINPGVILKFRSSGQLNIRNGLIAVGGTEKENKIIFTADTDDFYGGDTYNDGFTQPSIYHWQGIYFYNESIDDDCILKNAIIKYGSNSDPSNSIYHRSAITMVDASPTIQNVRFTSNGMIAITARNMSQPTISNCDFTDVGSYLAINNRQPSNVITAKNCWWGNETGPRHASNPDGTGATITDGVLFSPLAAELGIPENGDVSLNGTINPYDASLILQHNVNAITLNPKQQSVADVSGNGAVTSYDASMILQYNVGLISVFIPDPSNILRRPMNAAAAQGNTTIEFADVEHSENNSILVPIHLTTPGGVKSMDMQYQFDASHLNFKGISSQELPKGINTAFNTIGDNLYISLASAYDLGMTGSPISLSFEVKDNSKTATEFALKQALANETLLNTEGISINIPSKSPTGVHAVGKDNFINVWQSAETLHVRLNFTEVQKEITLIVTDISGRNIVSKQLYNVDSGIQTIELPVSTSGIHIVRVIGENINAAKKILL